MHLQIWQTGEQYYRSILNKDIVACKAMMQVAERWFSDRLLEKDDDFEWYFDERYANLAVSSFSQNLKHHEMHMYGKPFVLEPWEVAIVMQIDGWRSKKDHHIPRFQQCHVFVGRKNGKSSLLAGLAILSMVLCPPAAQIFTISTKEEAARIIWSMTKRMIAQADIAIRSLFRLKTHDIEMPAKSIRFRPLGSNSETLDGYLSPTAL